MFQKLKVYETKLNIYDIISAPYSKLNASQNNYKKEQEIHELLTAQPTLSQIMFHKKSPQQDFIKRTLL